MVVFETEGLPFTEFGYYRPYYVPKYLPTRNYILANDEIDVGSLLNDIHMGNDSPLLTIGGVVPPITWAFRDRQLTVALNYIFAYKALRYQKEIGW